MPEIYYKPSTKKLSGLIKTRFGAGKMLRTLKKVKNLILIIKN